MKKVTARKIYRHEKIKERYLNLVCDENKKSSRAIEILCEEFGYCEKVIYGIVKPRSMKEIIKARRFKHLFS